MNSKIKHRNSYILAIPVLVSFLVPQLSYANSFSDLWKKHGGEVLGTDASNLGNDGTKPEKESKISIPKIDIVSTTVDEQSYFIQGIISNYDQIEVIIHDKATVSHKEGRFVITGYIPPGGKEVSVRVKTRFGIDVLETLFVERATDFVSPLNNLSDLNPLAAKGRINSNAYALIIGVANYEKTKNKAEFADRDARQFADYAHLTLGVPKRNILKLVEKDADKGEIAFATKHKLFQLIEPGKSELFVFFAGHGLAHGDDLYLLPVDGRPEVVASTAISRSELFSDIAKTGAASVTVFLDSCYSGISRNGDSLVSARPIVLRQAETSVPPNFNVFSAADSSQISRPLDEKKHGLFSYFLMKGLEGAANKNGDDVLTASELHDFVASKVGRYSGLEQSPQFSGDPEKIIVRY